MTISWRATLCVLLLSTLTVAAQAPRPQQPFKSGADRVVVDVVALDKDGFPIADLQKDEIQLTVNGKPRDVSSLEFVRVADPRTRPAAAAAVTARAGDNT